MPNEQSAWERLNVPADEKRRFSGAKSSTTSLAAAPIINQDRIAAQRERSIILWALAVFFLLGINGFFAVSLLME